MSKKYEVTALGEVMLRLSVPEGERLEFAQKFDCFPGGAEANVVSALSNLGRSTCWFGALPDSPLGRIVTRHLRKHGVDTSVYWEKDGRIGTFYIEFASKPRNIQVYYDRASSAAAKLTSAKINWEQLLNTKILHLTGITPALSENCLEVTKEAILRAKKSGVKISFDVNYREKLWETKKAACVLKDLIKEADLLFCGEGDAYRLFGFSGNEQEIINSLKNLSGASSIVLTRSNQGVIGFSNEKFYAVDAPVVEMVDRIGAGDALAAGVIDGWLDGDFEKGLKYGTSLAAVCLTLNGDVAISSREELEQIVSGEAGKVKR